MLSSHSHRIEWSVAWSVFVPFRFVMYIGRACMSSGERCLFLCLNFICVMVFVGVLWFVRAYLCIAGVGEQVFDQTNTTKIMKNDIFGWIYRNKCQTRHNAIYEELKYKCMQQMQQFHRYCFPFLFMAFFSNTLSGFWFDALHLVFFIVCVSWWSIYDSLDIPPSSWPKT